MIPPICLPHPSPPLPPSFTMIGVSYNQGFYRVHPKRWYMFLFHVGQRSYPPIQNRGIESNQPIRWKLVKSYAEVHEMNRWIAHGWLVVTVDAVKVASRLQNRIILEPNLTTESRFLESAFYKKIRNHSRLVETLALRVSL